MNQTFTGSFSNRDFSDTTAEERNAQMSQTGQSFRSNGSKDLIKPLGAGGGQIRAVTQTAEARREAI